jgi:hypothetical protein
VRCPIIVGQDEPVSLMGVAVHPVEHHDARRHQVQLTRTTGPQGGEPPGVSRPAAGEWPTPFPGRPIGHRVGALLPLLSQTTPATAPRMITAAIAISQVRIPKTAPIAPYVLLSEMIVDEK